MKTIEQAISRSISHNEIVTIRATEAERMDLLAACDGSATTEDRDGTPMTECWGARDGNDWRVHAIHAEVRS